MFIPNIFEEDYASVRWDQIGEKLLPELNVA